MPPVAPAAVRRIHFCRCGVQVGVAVYDGEPTPYLCRCRRQWRVPADGLPLLVKGLAGEVADTAPPSLLSARAAAAQGQGEKARQARNKTADQRKKEPPGRAKGVKTRNQAKSGVRTRRP